MNRICLAAHIGALNLEPGAHGLTEHPQRGIGEAQGNCLTSSAKNDDKTVQGACFVVEASR